MNPRRALVPLAAALLALAAAAGLAASAGPDLEVEVSVEPTQPGLPLTATQEARAVVVVRNNGLDAAGAFEVDVWGTASLGAIVLGPHSLNVSGLAPGANVTLLDTVSFAPAFSGDVQVFVHADPAERTNDTQLHDNTADITVYFGPPAVARTVEDVADKTSGSRTLTPYSYLAFRLILRDGDSLIFQADAEQGALFDCYLLSEAAYLRYRDAREASAPGGPIEYVRDYSRTSTDHIAYTAEPLPPGTYYLVVENDERLNAGATPNGSLRIDYAVAVVNNSLPPWASLVVIGAAAAAIWATVRWRPHFDVRSPLMAVPPPEPEELDGEGEPPGPPSDLPEDGPDEQGAEPPAKAR